MQKCIYSLLYIFLIFEYQNIFRIFSWDNYVSKKKKKKENQTWAKALAHGFQLIFFNKSQKIKYTCPA